IKNSSLDNSKNIVLEVRKDIRRKMISENEIIPSSIQKLFLGDHPFQTTDFRDRGVLSVFSLLLNILKIYDFPDDDLSLWDTNYKYYNDIEADLNRLKIESSKHPDHMYTSKAINTREITERLSKMVISKLVESVEIFDDNKILSVKTI
ncbi:163_t:CDS:2, partial [Dentiscutata erythropus]